MFAFTRQDFTTINAVISNCRRYASTALQEARNAARRFIDEGENNAARNAASVFVTDEYIRKDAQINLETDEAFEAVNRFYIDAARAAKDAGLENGLDASTDEAVEALAGWIAGAQNANTPPAVIAAAAGAFDGNAGLQGLYYAAAFARSRGVDVDDIVKELTAGETPDPKGAFFNALDAAAHAGFTPDEIDVLTSPGLVTFKGGPINDAPRAANELRAAYHNAVDEGLDVSALFSEYHDGPETGALLERLETAVHKAAALGFSTARIHHAAAGEALDAAPSILHEVNAAAAAARGYGVDVQSKVESYLDA